MEEQNLDPFIEKKGFFYKCNLCVTTLNGLATVRSHIAGSNHRSRVVSQANVNKLTSPMQNLTWQDLPPLIERFGGQFRCLCCDSTLNSVSQITAHVSGAKHLKNEAARVFQKEKETPIQSLNSAFSANSNVYSTAHLQSALNYSTKPNLPPFIEAHGAFYHCTCCAASSLNSDSQIREHVSGLKHLKAVKNCQGVPMDTSPNNSDTIKKFGGASIENGNYLGSDICVIDTNELMNNINFFKVDEEIVF